MFVSNGRRSLLFFLNKIGFYLLLCVSAGKEMISGFLLHWVLGVTADLWYRVLAANIETITVWVCLELTFLYWSWSELDYCRRNRKPLGLLEIISISSNSWWVSYGTSKTSTYSHWNEFVVSLKQASEIIRWWFFWLFVSGCHLASTWLLTLVCHLNVTFLHALCLVQMVP